MNEYRTLRIDPDNPHEAIQQLRSDIEMMKGQHRETGMREVLLAKMIARHG